ncbi:MAG TPA: ABC transporter permease [Bryobacteraceae bacterium]|nr:ABC transporter permease [Bryobacteraceae bacterium]
MNWLPWRERKNDHDRELDEEIQADFALEIQQRLEAGATREEAEFAARRDFGNVTRVKEVTRDMWGWSSLERLLQDARYAVRRLRNAPAFTITAVLTLALGIGATTSIFTLVYTVLLKSLAVANPSELYRLGKEARCCYEGGYSQKNEFSLVSYDLYKHFRDNTKSFAELAAFQAGQEFLGVRREGNSEAAQSYRGEFVSGNYFTMFGIGAYAGRLLIGSDDRRGAPAVAVMSYQLWQQKYGSDPSVIGSVFDINDRPFTVIGITPQPFFGDALRNPPPDFFLPLATEPLLFPEVAFLDAPDGHWLDLIGRIRPGAKRAGVEAQMRVELKQWLRSHWSDMDANERANFPYQTLFVSPGGAGISGMREQYEHWLQILMMVTGFVLLIVCANVANLMLVRGMERRRQVSLSMALGAQAKRLVRQALTESILLSLLGGAAGLAVAFEGTRLILHFAFPQVGGLPGIPIDASPSLPVLVFAFGISLITGIAFGIGPAWMATRVDPIEILRGGSRSTVRAGSLPRKALVVSQVALSLVLLSASGLLTAALQNLENQDFGFDQDRRLVATIDPTLAGYRAQQLTPLYRRIHDSLSSIPGVSAVALSLYSPLSGNNRGTGVWVDGHPAPGPNDENFALWNRVTAGYFTVLGNPIMEGRDISEQDTTASRNVAVVNEAFARKYLKNEDAVGKHFGRSDTGDSRQYEIVGIAKNARYLIFNYDKPIGPSYFLPEAQHDRDSKGKTTASDVNSHFLRDIVIVTRPGASLSLTRVRQAMASVDPNLPIISVRTLKEQVALQFTQQRLIARLTSFFGVLSLVLACVGLYGVTAYNAECRVTEIGLRIALGAKIGDVISLVLRGAFALIVLGLMIGLPLTAAGGEFLGSQLYGMNPYNPVVMLIAVLALGLSALVASLIPALRASSISPLEALRAE